MLFGMVEENQQVFHSTADNGLCEDTFSRALSL